MNRINVLNYLKENGFVKYEHKMPLEDSVSTLVYLIKDVEQVYIHDSYNPLYYFIKHGAWVNKGRVDRLPRAVAVRLPAGYLETPDEHVNVYIKQGHFDREVIKDWFKTNTGVLRIKDTNVKNLHGVLIVKSKTDRKYFRVVVYNAGLTKETALYKFLQNAKMHSTNSIDPINMVYVKWCVRNKQALIDNRLLVTNLVENVTLEHATRVLKEYTSKTSSRCLNAIIPLLRRKG